VGSAPTSTSAPRRPVPGRCPPVGVGSASLAAVPAPAAPPRRLAAERGLCNRRSLTSPCAFARRIPRWCRRRWRRRRAPWAKKAGPQPLPTEWGLLEGKRHPEIQPDDVLHHPRLRLRHRAPMHAGHQGLALCGTQRHGFCWLVHNRCLAWLRVNAESGAGRPWPTDGCAWLCAAAQAAARQGASAERVLPVLARSPPW
jgi:hypothetical protein